MITFQHQDVNFAFIDIYIYTDIYDIHNYYHQNAFKIKVHLNH